MANKTLMVDLSSNNASVDLREHWAAGFRLLALKATQGTTYAWSQAHALSKLWHSFGGLLMHYHFLVPGGISSGVQQANWFWHNVRGDLRHGDRFVVDAETNGETRSEVYAFINRCGQLAPGVRGLEYGGPYFLRDNRIGSDHGWGLWIADYASKIAFVPPGWIAPTAWQFTQAGSEPGVGGQVDVSRVHPVLLHPVLRYGDVNFAVLDAKAFLHARGYRHSSVRSNVYGAGLRADVANYKRDHGLQPYDGTVFGGRMWAAVNRGA